MKLSKPLIALATIAALSGCATVPNSGQTSGQTGANAVSIEETSRGVGITFADGILFASGKSRLEKDSEKVIERLAQLIQQTNKPIAVEGHTDNQGGGNYNLKLSQRRADTVVRALVAHGVDANRLHADGYGFSRPIADNSTPAGRQYNRRVEVHILGARKNDMRFSGHSNAYFDDTFSARMQGVVNDFRRLPLIGNFF